VISGLESANLKMVRAQHHIKHLDRCIRRYARADSHKIIGDPDAEGTVDVGSQPEPTISLLIGEIVYQFRSALDHLAFALVERNINNVIPFPKRWKRNCEFPLFLDIPNNGDPPIPYDLPVPREPFNKALPGISDAAFIFIESIQPYYRLGTASAMKSLTQLSRIDKHHHFHVVIPKMAVHWHHKLNNGTLMTHTRGGFEHGAKVPTTENPGIEQIVDMKRSFSPYITFDETALGAGYQTLEVQDILQFCLEQIQSVIIPAFDKFINNP
jgi:hypothetical protein